MFIYNASLPRSRQTRQRVRLPSVARGLSSVLPRVLQPTTQQLIVFVLNSILNQKPLKYLQLHLNFVVEFDLNLIIIVNGLTAVH